MQRIEIDGVPVSTAPGPLPGSAAERVGFRAEGVLRQRSLHRGVPVDDVVHGLLAGGARLLPTA